MFSHITHFFLAGSLRHTFLFLIFLLALIPEDAQSSQGLSIFRVQQHQFIGPSHHTDSSFSSFYWNIFSMFTVLWHFLRFTINLSLLLPVSWHHNGCPSANLIHSYVFPTFVLPIYFSAWVSFMSCPLSIVLHIYQWSANSFCWVSKWENLQKCLRMAFGILLLTLLIQWLKSTYLCTCFIAQQF